MKKKTLVKICGITNLKDAYAAVDAGADALGFVFYQGSPRFITLGKARRIISRLPGSILKIGVFVNENPVVLESLFQDDYLDFFQFSGGESAETCRRYNGKVIKAFRVGNGFDVRMTELFEECSMFLFDAYERDRYGGTGKTFDTGVLKDIHTRKPVVIAGGLNELNVQSVVRMHMPHMVDVSSGVETLPGKKDDKKMKRFIERCKNTL